MSANWRDLQTCPTTGNWRQLNVLDISCKSLFLTGLQDCAGCNKIVFILNLSVTIIMILRIFYSKISKKMHNIFL